jgi:hypothetical protein
LADFFDFDDFDLLLVVWDDLCVPVVDLWEVEAVLVDFVVLVEAVAVTTSTIATVTNASDWKIRRLKRKGGTSEKIYEFQYQG